MCVWTIILHKYKGIWMHFLCVHFLESCWQEPDNPFMSNTYLFADVSLTTESERNKCFLSTITQQNSLFYQSLIRHSDWTVMVQSLLLTGDSHCASCQLLSTVTIPSLSSHCVQQVTDGNRSFAVSTMIPCIQGLGFPFYICASCLFCLSKTHDSLIHAMSILELQQDLCGLTQLILARLCQTRIAGATMQFQGLATQAQQNS